MTPPELLPYPGSNRLMSGVRRFFFELLWFGLKEARACLFAGLFFLAMFVVPRSGVGPLARYDLLLIIALGIQALMLATKLETWDEFKAITLFHIVGFILELFKTSSAIGAWSYPDFAWSKVGGVPLFAGFMYAAVGSYIIQAWRLLDLHIRHHPPLGFAVIASLLIYLNFFTHHYIGDYRWYITALVVGLYARSEVVFTPYDKPRKMPLLVGFMLVGFFIWLAENISTFMGVWRYPNQLGAWSVVHVGKWSSWSLLVLMSFTLTLFLKDVKKRIHVAR
ncbi:MULTISPECIES: DUF817 domain-containing protein [Mangrovibacter]|uniref:Uncharacterized membrane protein YoaT (DUF817 family) n=1 Tax=Mangrovibacter plantisponsor TaxID=451513 RepID=A0A317Q7T7_9ENTR|nr:MULTISPECIES: DUF817 domain-containing protein [Mangrovibacter]KEA54000.1 membrane protein [Mangrovibacter sp. MFB070]PWW12631.1 uncharacterized membrane protein YoaT (DUF817 family) [Mangrovibacter plantisponsor]